MDLLSTLPEEIFNEIMSYLSGKDILKASLVSKGWYQMIGHSNDCMQTVTLKFNYLNYKNDLSPVLKSERIYQNLIIGFENRLLRGLGVEPKIRDILKKFSKSLVKLQTSQDFQQICDLPKLKELKYTNYLHRSNKKFLNYFCSNGVFSMCNNITKLVVICRDIDDRYIRMFQNSIKNMRHLKDLTVNNMVFLKNLKPADCKFKLEQFEVICPTDLTDFYDVLVHHQSTMKVIKLSQLYWKDVSFILSEFPKLHTLNAYYMDNHYEGLEIPVNLTVKNFLVRGVGHYPTIAEIIMKLKNLQQFRIGMLCSRLIPELFACQSLTLVEFRMLGKEVTENQKNLMINNEKIKFIEVPFMY
jgi:hypothetical protein